LHFSRPYTFAENGNGTMQIVASIDISVRPLGDRTEQGPLAMARGDVSGEVGYDFG
jgi:hypothetical protein